jgi:hypothetical protein
MISADADRSIGATGMACEAVTAARLRPIAKADAASNLIDFLHFLSSFAATRQIHTLRKQHASLVTRPAPHQ